MTLVGKLTVVEHCQAATDPPLEYLIIDYCEEIYQNKF